MTTDEPSPVAGAKTFGPFTGRQLTVICCTLIVMLLFPVGAWAVTGSNVFIADSATGVRAKVDSGGKLQTRAFGSTLELASSPVLGLALAANGQELAQLDVTSRATIRVTVGNACSSPSNVAVSIAHLAGSGVDVGAIDLLDSLTVAPCQNVSRTYDLPGTTISLLASPTNHATGSTIFYTVFAR